MTDSYNKQTIALKLFEIANERSASDSTGLMESVELVMKAYSQLLSVASGIPYSDNSSAS